MKSLLKWQTVSLFSRGLAMTIGIAQSVVIVRILSVAEYGMVTLVMSIGGAFGVYQHLGLASGSTREISASKDDNEIFKIFITSVVIRYFVSFPLALILFFAAEYLAINQYGNSELIIPLKIFSLVLVIQGVQSIFNSVISGTQRFKQLFTYQVVVAVVGLFIYIPLIYLYKVTGYFVALAVFNLVASISLGIISLWPLKGKLVFPKKEDFKRLLKNILSISLGIYVVKIIFTYWQKSGPLLLGLTLTPEEIGIFGFALLFSAKLLVVSDSVTTVNLPVLSRKFADNFDEFKSLFVSNFDKVYVFIVFAAMSAVFWSKEIIQLFVGGDKYNASFPLILPLVFAFIIYSVVNVVKSSILVPAKLIKEMIIGYVLMLFGTVAFYLVTNEILGDMRSMAYGMVLGVAISLLYIVFATSSKLKFSFMNWSHFLLFFFALGVSLINTSDFTLQKVGIYLASSVGYALILIFLKKLDKGNEKQINN